MSIWEKIKAGFARFAQGRNGVDNLGMYMFFTGLFLQLLDSILGTGVLYILGTVLYVWALFRMLSRNTVKRGEENRRFTEWLENAKTKTRQFFVRLKNCRKYKYFKCPTCKSRLRLARGSGEKTLVCSKCKTTIKQKA